MLYFRSVYSLKMLTSREKAMIKNVYIKTKSMRKTASMLEISKSTVENVINDKFVKQKKKPGPKNIIDRHELLAIKRFIRREVNESHKVNASIIKNELTLTASLSTIRRTITNLGFCYGSFVKTLPLTKFHRQQRLDYAKYLINNLIDYKKIVFTDEKRFSCDGPDSIMTYQDTFDNKKVKKRIKRQSGGGSVMVIGMITYDGNFQVKVIKGKYKSTHYLADLAKFIDFLDLKFGKKNYYFMQDNSAVHTAKIVTEWLSIRQINLLPHPARSPDLNLIENIWHLMEERIYSNKQYKSSKDLEPAIEDAVDWINTEKKPTVKSLFDSFSNRIAEVLSKNGGHTKY